MRICYDLFRKGVSGILVYFVRHLSEQLLWFIKVLDYFGSFLHAYMLVDLCQWLCT